MAENKSAEPNMPHTAQEPAPKPFPSNLPARSAPPPSEQPTWKDSMRNLFSLRFWRRYECKGKDKPTRLRRSCMIFLLVLRAGITSVACIAAGISGRFAELGVYLILGLVGWWFIAWCVARIGDCVGERKVGGLVVGRRQLDYFLLGCAIIHLGVLTGFFFWWNSWGLAIIWLGTGIVIYAVAWIAGWEPLYPASNV